MVLELIGPRLDPLVEFSSDNFFLTSPHPTTPVTVVSIDPPTDSLTIFLLKVVERTKDYSIAVSFTASGCKDRDRYRTPPSPASKTLAKLVKLFPR